MLNIAVVLLLMRFWPVPGGRSPLGQVEPITVQVSVGVFWATWGWRRVRGDRITRVPFFHGGQLEPRVVQVSVGAVRAVLPLVGCCVAAAGNNATTPGALEAKAADARRRGTRR